MKFNGGEIPVRQILAARDEMIRQNQTGRHPACRDCPHLVTKLWPQPRYPFHTIGIANFTRCNLRCNYCFLQTAVDRSILNGGDQPYRVMPVLQQLIRDGLLAPDAFIDWGGGEPTIYPEFDSILELTTLRGAGNLVHTNGTRFPAPLKQALPAGKVHIICSVDAGSRETYKLIKEEDLYDRVWKNLAEYQRVGCLLYVKYIVKEENCNSPDLVAFVQQVRQLGSPKVLVDIDYDFPIPSAAVLKGLCEMVQECKRNRVPVDVGYTGTYFTPEAGTKELVLQQTRAGLFPALKKALRGMTAAATSFFASLRQSGGLK